MSSLEQQIFQKGSTTYYFSSKFFPPKVRDDVFKLYSFVRVADDYVDWVPAQTDKFQDLRRAWERAADNKLFDTTTATSDSVDERVIKNIIYVVRKYDFDPAWIESFLDSMQADLDKKQYHSIDDTLWYIYGSAEVIGLMMSKIMGLTEEARHAAQLQGRAMQFINFLRDIDEDNQLGRCYFPQPDLQLFHLKNLSKEMAHEQPQLFCDFMRFQLVRYNQWQKEANEGFKLIPRRLRVPLQTAVDMYNWTARQIEKDPFIVFDHKVKPRKRRVLLRASQLLILEARS